MTTGEWTSERGRTLLRIARASLTEALGFGEAPDGGPEGCYGEPWLREPGATFVTLRRRGELRGCVGSILAYRPLFEDVWRNARASAFHDTRFPPVVPEELAEIGVELSLLSPPEPLPCAGEAEALRLLRPGVDGVILECEEHRGTFLPQVWEQLPDPRDFLDRLRHKAGLRSGFWSPEVRLSRYTVLKWGEEQAAQQRESRASHPSGWLTPAAATGHHGSGEEGGVMFRKILVPVDFSAKNDAALDSALQIAGGNDAGGGEITLLHVIEVIEHIDFKEMSDFYRGLETRATARLFTMKETLQEKGARVRHEVLFGKRAETIVRYAGEMAADLMILSSHKVDRDHPALGLGTLSYGIAIVARCPVLLVK